MVWGWLRAQQVVLRHEYEPASDLRALAESLRQYVGGEGQTPELAGRTKRARQEADTVALKELWAAVIRYFIGLAAQAGTLD